MTELAGSLAKRGLFSAAWRLDVAFCEAAAKCWPEDYALAQRGGYDRGAAQKLTYRYQGWRACREDSAP